MNNMIKSTYVAPIVEVIEMENEGVIALSNTSNVPDYGNGGELGVTTTNTQRNPYYGSSSEIEDMINDILTIEQ